MLRNGTFCASAVRRVLLPALQLGDGSTPTEDVVDSLALVPLTLAYAIAATSHGVEYCSAADRLTLATLCVLAGVMDLFSLWRPARIISGSGQGGLVSIMLLAASFSPCVTIGTARPLFFATAKIPARLVEFARELSSDNLDECSGGSERLRHRSPSASGLFLSDENSQEGARTLFAHGSVCGTGSAGDASVGARSLFSRRAVLHRAVEKNLRVPVLRTTRFSRRSLSPMP